MNEKRRCSILFHLLVPSGRWQTVIGTLSSSASGRGAPAPLSTAPPERSRLLATGRCHRDWAVELGALGPQPGLSSFLSGERPVTAGATVDGTRTGAVVESSVELTPSPHGSFLRHYNGPVFPHAARSRRNVSLRTTERRPAKIVLGATFCRTRQEKSGVAAKWLSASSRANKVKNKVKM